MAVAAESRRKKRRKKNTSPIIAWLPVMMGLLAIPVALHAASILALSGPGGLTLLYPFAELVRNPMLRLPADIAETAAQWSMYVQFPVYGLLMTWMLRQSKGFMAALGAAILLHAAAWGTTYLLMIMRNPLLRA